MAACIEDNKSAIFSGMNEKYFLICSNSFYVGVISGSAVALESFGHLVIWSYALSRIRYHSLLMFPGVLLICVPCNPFTLPYNHCNTTVLMVMVNAAPENTIALCGVSS